MVLLALFASALRHNRKRDLASFMALCYNVADITRPFCNAVEG